jgi:GT2 family glycosyltransferase
MKKLAVITVNYKNYADTEDFIASFSKQTNKDFHIYLVDVSPQPEPFPEYKNVTRIHAENKGYAFGLNTGYKLAQQDGYNKFVFMNNDVLVAQDFVDRALMSISAHPSSLIGGKIYYAKGFEYHKSRYSQKQEGHVLWYAGGIMDWANAFTVHRGVDDIDRGQYDAFEETEFVTGCLMCFDTELVKKAGLMDESYFLYYEDADWCARISKQGLHMYYDPTIIIYHKNSQSTDGAGSELHEEYQKKNRKKFGLRYAPFRTKLHLIKNSILGSR